MTQRIAFVDSRVATLSGHIHALDCDIAVFQIDAERDGLTQLNEAMARAGHVDTIDIFCHARPGALLLGNAEIDAKSFNQVVGQQCQTGQSSPSPSDVFIYGCEAAQGESGALLLEAFAQHFDAAIGGSSNRIGGKGEARNWSLDVSLGGLTSAQSLALPAFERHLATIIGGAGDDSIVGTAGNDSLDGGDGNDTIVASLGVDTLVGGLGTDTLLVDLDYSAFGGVNALGYFVGSGNFANFVNSTSSYATISSLMPSASAFFDLQLNTGLAAFSATGFESIVTNLVGTTGADLLIYQGGTKYWGGTGIDTFYADWSSTLGPITWVNDPTLTQTVNGVSVAGLERLLITTGSGADQINNNYAGNGTTDYIDTGAGNDTINGGLGNDSIIAGAGNDSVVTNGGNEVVDLGDGNDTVTASLGVDAIAGGLGTDTLLVDLDYSAFGGVNALGYFVGSGNFANFVNSTSSYATISSLMPSASAFFDLQLNTGLAAFSATGFESIVTNLVGTTGADLLIYQGGTKYWGGAGTDTFYADWSTSVASIGWVNNPVTTQLVNGVSVAGLERLLITTGSGGDRIDNSLVGVATADYIDTGAGNDTLNGGLGVDTLIGGAGNDVYIVDSQTDVITELVGGGTDFVQSSVTYSLAAVANVERLTLTGVVNIDGAGNTLDNLLFGNAGNNVLTGGAGVDTLSGGAGIDTLVGGLGNDVYVLDSSTDTVTELVGQGVDLVQSSVTQTLLADNVENLQLTGVASIDGAGNALANNLLGNSGNNTLSGLAGNDTLNGGAGIDTLIGGLGNDVYQVDSQTDVIIELAGEGTDFIQASVSYSMAGLANVERLVLLGSANIDGTGSDDANNLFGNSGNNVLTGGLGGDTLNGGAGIDTLIGGLGNDVFQVDSTTDVIIENVGEGTDFVQTLVNYDLNLAANVERLTLLGGANINGVGNELDNVLFGNAGNNSLSGGLGADILNGAGGVDTLIGGQGNDVYQIDTLTDSIIEMAGEGIDTVQTSVSLASLVANVENVGLLGSAGLSAVGNALGNFLVGNAGNNQLSGLDGADVLDGGAGIDTLIGGLGNDIYRVDSGTDLIIELAGEGTDFVQTTVSYTLTAANVENLTLLGTAAINGTGSAANNFVLGNSGANSLNGGAGNDSVNGAGGADTINGGTGNDVLAGGADLDTFVFDTALDAATNVDVIADFQPGEQIQLSAAVFTALVVGALDASHFFSGAGLTGSTSVAQGAGVYYNASTGDLYYDSDGFGGTAAVRFASAGGNPAFTIVDFTVGP